MAGMTAHHASVGSQVAGLNRLRASLDSGFDVAQTVAGALGATVLLGTDSQIPVFAAAVVLEQQTHDSGPRLEALSPADGVAYRHHLELY